MAIIEAKKNTKEKTAKTKAVKAVALKTMKTNTMPSGEIFSLVISKPRITEKSGNASQKLNAYTFEVSNRASKNDVSKAIKELYKFTPAKINMINLPRKSVFSRGKKGWGKSVKKAVVYLKKGDKIDFI